jgi:phosphatidylglycerol:prolipoprotein diacylglycerol transferase
MFYNNIDPVLINIGGLEIRYYGVLFVAGLIISYFLVSYLVKKRGTNLKPGEVEELFVYAIVGIIVGSRLFHVFVYNYAYYASRPLEIFAVWQGGLAFHGGLIGLIAAGYVFCRKKGVSFYEVADIVAIPAAIGLGLGRISNFINSELYGKITTVPWAVKFQGVDGFRHPSQLYEAAKNFFIFGVLWSLKSKILPRGFIFWLFITLYGALRFAIEFYKETETFFLGLSLGQILSAAMLITGLTMLAKLKRFK